MNRFLKVLYDEHALIMSAISLSEDIGRLRSRQPQQYEDMVRRLITFLREYADQFHHHKEEIILFPEMAKKNELMEFGIIKEMFDNHEDFREMIAGIERFLTAKKFDQAQALLENYVENLMDHIAVENEEVFQAAESLFTEDELERIGYRFEDCDRDLGDAKKEELAELARLIRNELVLAE